MLEQVLATLQNEAGLVSWILGVIIAILLYVIKKLWSRLDTLTEQRIADKDQYVVLLEKNIQTMESLKVVVQAGSK